MGCLPSELAILQGWQQLGIHSLYIYDTEHIYMITLANNSEAANNWTKPITQTNKNSLVQYRLYKLYIHSTISNGEVSRGKTAINLNH